MSKTSAAETAAADAPDVPENKVTFTVERLVRDSHIFLGVESFVARGAFHGLSDDDELTVVDAKKRVTAWSKAPAEAPPTPEAE